MCPIVPNPSATTLTVTFNPQSPNPDFTFNIAPGTSPEGIYRQMQTSFAAAGIPSRIVGAKGNSIDETEHCSNQVLWIKTGDRQIVQISKDTNLYKTVSEAGVTTPVPTLTGWGAILTTGILLLMILWHLKRVRQQRA